jgi:hypothetical protein
MEHSDHWIRTGWHGSQWHFQNNEKTMEHSDHWIQSADRIVKGWQRKQWDLQNNEKTIQRELRNNEKTTAHSDHYRVYKKKRPLEIKHIVKI